MRIAIIGRPNVGKSTLFNRLVGKRLALVDDRPGVTRDLREGDGRLGDLKFTVVDTAGLESATDDSLPARMRRLTDRAVAQADLCLFMVDGRAGITADDRTFAELLLRQGAETIVLVNKSEGNKGDDGYYAAFELGLGEPVRVSSEHGEGFDDLYAVLRPVIDAHDDAVPVALAPEEEDPDKPLQIAVIGRPNAGKSTLVNRLLGEERLLTGPEAGITRDAIGLEFNWAGRMVKVFDTAGMRKKAKIHEKLEKMSVSDGLRAVQFAEVVIVLLDAEGAFEAQDLKIADLAAREGRAVVIAVSKWDLVTEKQKRLVELKEMVDRLLPQLRGVPLVTVSALDGRGLDRLHAAVLKVYETWNIRISTARLNKWLLEAVSRHPPPAPGGRRIRIRYMTQAKSRPPTFVLFCSRPEDLGEDYTRYLANGLRERFELHGVPLRLLMRKGENPYEGRARKR